MWSQDRIKKEIIVIYQESNSVKGLVKIFMLAAHGGRWIGG